MSARPRVLLVGAYERDNFGDLLFLLVTERYLADADVVAAAPFAADMTALVDREVPAYPALLDEGGFDAVWTVGGQVGSIDAGRAYRLSASPGELRRFLRMTRWKRRAVLESLGLGAAPYIPDPGPGLLRIVNSAGVSGIRDVPQPRREQLLDVLRAQDHLAVRDRGSSQFLDGHGIAHDLVPDAVHALGVLDPHPPARGDAVLFQLSQGRLADLGHEWVAAQLAHSRELRGRPLRLLLAGAASGHDSAEAYADLADRVRRLAPGADVEVLRERRPEAIVEQIRTARAVIGASLHVRIVASAHHVPRVSLARPKVTRYARTWDAAMPYAVTLDRLDAALAEAFAQAARPEVVAHDAHLGRLADAHLRRAGRPDRCRTSPEPTLEG